MGPLSASLRPGGEEPRVLILALLFTHCLTVTQLLRVLISKGRGLDKRTPKGSPGSDSRSFQKVRSQNCLADLHLKLESN